ncbi:MAG: long-chain-fatty-acid--AMP ligase FAAL26/FadD26 [Mycobacterium pseudokansasii]|uniref:Long-chain-fatty-acid--AMP ligase FadD26 n=1 Tax=Mycobacterium pseudokansasii TaxID=2341080 RepID=A0A498QQZ3_9MYCO|nr:long-chain-fatty-acid--AMP ligase FAAL26/FadD26 [Mycobacterium pseudokansasii]MBY0390179.1 long-chain-fatty-acid--AMP ligase FAAL26/FadD26 [Mycobacterium pseudokansasii]VAZ92347.1 Long-chain-fatty-acid--AMP ligase FadD26 [Mycobacterium pseudokansasii]VAZ93457.1 Long-chain-fatty-acid--AMP ligase FadD26 [Mycobacterium pseudokansasii]VBA49326.1 Long-chain-fatty-acid--AMP ligase FadD26 [Mycobacterium pseudokansasii]
MPVIDSSVPALLKQRADQHADTTAYTFIDYGLDPKGFAESLTWSQVYGRACTIAEELRLYGSPGDRVAILAPQGLEYVIAFLGALQAGFIAVPLSTPQYGIHDDRVSAVLRDANPVAILTTSSVVADVTKYANAQDGRPAPFVIEVDLLDLDSQRQLPGPPRLSTGAAYLQYTSGSTRTPAGVIVSHKNVIANVTQSLYGYFGGPEMPIGTVLLSWLPLFHDMGLILGIFAPLVAGRSAVLFSPMSFLRRPACWMQLLATSGTCFTAAPNFAFELAVRRTSDEDMAGLDLGGVVGIVSGSERIHVATVKRFTERFARYNLSPTAVRPSYGLAEATLYVAAPEPGSAPTTVRFDYEQLTAGQARRIGTDGPVGTELISYGSPDPSAVRIVDPETMVENPAGTVGEIWVHGDHVAMGYWRKPEQTTRTFNAKLVNPSPGVPKGPWLRTGDLGVISDGELFIMGRIKDLLIVDGRNHYPDDIEATIQEITGGRVAAIAVPDDITEQLVAIIELKRRGASAEDAMRKLRSVKREVTSAISRSHSLRVADLVLVSPGSIPITTSGKIRRSACVERYRRDGFKRLDVSA